MRSDTNLPGATRPTDTRARTSPVPRLLATVCVASAVLSAGVAAAQQREAAPSAAASSDAPALKLPAEPEAVVESPARAERPVVRDPLAPAAKSPIEPAPPKVPAFDRGRVHHVDEDGPTKWARGATYKARFATDGTSYVPYLGADSPRNFPMTMRLDSVAFGGEPVAFDATAAPIRAGDAIRYERGTLVEVYELEAESIEQLFVFDALPAGIAGGELVVRIATETELEARTAPDRLEFANERGAVRYGRATALDAAGASVGATTTLTAGKIEIRVPAEFVAAARFPLTIDPIVSTFSIDTNPPNAFLPDCAFDATTGRWLVVHEEIFSATDHDVVWRLLGTLSGSSLGSGYVDTNLGDYWANPACANNAALDNFFVVAQVGLPTSGTRKILGKTVVASNGAFGTTLDVASEDPLVDKLNPDVGGDPLGLPSYYCVVWEKVFSASDRDILFRRVDPGNSLAGIAVAVDVTGGTYDTSPSISKSNDGVAWNVVWQRRSTTMPFQQDIRGARIGWAGASVASSFSIDNSVSNTSSPRASTSLDGTNRWAVAYEKDFGSDYDVGMKLLDGTTVLDDVSVTGLEVIAGQLSTLLENQIQPDVDSDGMSFAVTYSEQFLGSSVDYDVFASTVAVVGNQLHLSEGHRPIATSLSREGDPAIASTEGSGLAWRLELVVLGDATSLSSSGNIDGGLYDHALYTSFCHPTLEGVPACPCGNGASGYGRGCNNSANTGGAQLVPNGFSAIGGDTMVLTSQFEPATALSIFTQGNGLVAGSAVFGQGIRCVGGTLKRLYMKNAVGGGVTAPAGGDPTIHARSAALGDPLTPGLSRYYYVYYRDPVVLGGCPSGSTFNTTQSVQALWIP